MGRVSHKIKGPAPDGLGARRPKDGHKIKGPAYGGAFYAAAVEVGFEPTRGG